MLEDVTAPFANVSVSSFHGLLVDYCREHDIRAIVKGLRAVTDFDYELQMAQMNQRLSGVDTLFMSTSPEWSFVASSLVKEVATFGGDVAHLLPPTVHRRLVERIAELAQDKKLEGIAHIQDESDKSGMRVVIELKRGEVPEVVLNNLYKNTQLQDTFGMNMVALVDG